MFLTPMCNDDVELGQSQKKAKLNLVRVTVEVSRSPSMRIVAGS